MIEAGFWVVVPCYRISCSRSSNSGEKVSPIHPNKRIVLIPGEECAQGAAGSEILFISVPATFFCPILTVQTALAPFLYGCFVFSATYCAFLRCTSGYLPEISREAFIRALPAASPVPYVSCNSHSSFSDRSHLRIPIPSSADQQDTVFRPDGVPLCSAA